MPGPPDQNKNNAVVSGAAQSLGEHGRRILKAIFDRINPWHFAVAAGAFFSLSVVSRWFGIDNKLVSLVVSATLVAFCLFVFKLGPFFRSEFARAIRAMWMPLAVTIGAGVLLFYEGQGRDLGVGLLREDVLQILLLCPILIYWGLNNWH